MKYMIGAVFGHYDSRGGTMFMEMSKQTNKEFKRVCGEYDQMFAYDPSTDDYDPPSKDNFMYLVRLALPNDTVVVRTGNAADSLGGTDLEVIGVVVYGGDDSQDDATDAQRDSVVGVPLFEMEFVPVPDGRYGYRSFEPDDEEEEDKGLLKYVHQNAQTVAGRTCIEIPNWNDDAYGFVVIPAA